MTSTLTIGRNPSLAEEESWRFLVTSSVGGILINRTRTIDATPTELLTITPGHEKCMLAEIMVTARQIGGIAGVLGQVGGYLVYSSWKKIGGILTLLGATHTPREALEDEPAWQAEVVISADRPTVQVTGALNMEITWIGQMRTWEVEK